MNSEHELEHVRRRLRTMGLYARVPSDPPPRPVRVRYRSPNGSTVTMTGGPDLVSRFLADHMSVPPSRPW